MICKTEAIVLRTYKYQESNLIAVLYTKQAGVKSFLIKGFRSPKNRRKFSYFQPLSWVEIVFVEKPNRELQQIKESKSSQILFQIQESPIKLSIGLSIIEIFYQCVKEETSNEALFDFLSLCILKIDRSEDRLIQLFIFYLVHLTGFLGFFPNDMSQGARSVSLNIHEGIIRAEDRNPDPIAKLIRDFMNKDIEACRAIRFDQDTKRSLIKTLFNYYYIHVDGFTYPNTLRVFSEVFG